MYQVYMKQIPIPTHRGSVIPFNTWMGLGKSIKQLYGQPLHYLTNSLLRQWDQLRIGSEDENKPLDTIIHPCKAEATIWLMEEVHRHTSSHLHLAKIWHFDPMHHTFVDNIFPQLWTTFWKARALSFYLPCAGSVKCHLGSSDLFRICISVVWRKHSPFLSSACNLLLLAKLSLERIKNELYRF